MAAAVHAHPSNRFLLLSVAALMSVSIWLQVTRDRGWLAYESATPLLWVPSAAVLQRASLGFDNLVADIYWMRAVVYYGGRRLESRADRNYNLLYPLLDVVTRLDPRFKTAFRFGAIFLTEAYPAGPGRPDQAIALLERGLADNPTAWEYAHDIGFVYYWWLEDYTAAAKWFARASTMTGAPGWLKLLAATTLAEGGDRASSRLLWRHILDNAEGEWMKNSATLRLRQLDAMDALDELNAIGARYAARVGRPATSWDELVRGERLRGVPLDPGGTPFELDPATGRIDLSRRSSLWPLPTG
ncbi:MAG: hypothetical protein H0T71_13230, partial [Acidobacteria bacterium]|nr:hypothetical protein [Acidobacteriota bacterium]